MKPRDYVESMEPEIPPDTPVPAALIPEIKAAAEEEHREPSQLVGEAVTRYLAERRLFGSD